MRTLMNPANGQQVTVPDAVAADYVSRGWVALGAPALAVPDPLDTMTVAGLREYAEAHGIELHAAKLKADIRAVIDAAES